MELLEVLITLPLRKRNCTCGCYYWTVSVPTTADTIENQWDLYYCSGTALRLLEQSMIMMRLLWHDHSCFGYRRKSCCVWIQLEQLLLWIQRIPLQPMELKCGLHYYNVTVTVPAGALLERYRYQQLRIRLMNNETFTLLWNGWLLEQSMIMMPTTVAAITPLRLLKESWCVWIAWATLLLRYNVYLYIHQWNCWMLITLPLRKQ
jgi:hypothetical protein